MNALVEHLARVCAERRLDEKRLIAPSRRVAYQWIDQVTRSGQPVLNVHVDTTRSLAIGILSDRLVAGDFTPATSAVRRLVTAAAWSSALGGAAGSGYLGTARTTPRLLALAERTLEDLRLAGIDAAAMRGDAFEERRKGAELGRVLAAYARELAARGLIDWPDALRLAAARVRAEPMLWTSTTLLVPADLRRTPLEAALLAAFPDGCVETLAVDRPAAPGSRGAAASDLERLAWLPQPAEAPPPVGDGTVRIVHAVGEVNEVRRALRSCLAEGTPLDEAEIVCTTPEYGPLLYETAQRVFEPRPAEDLGVPVTFADGVPARLSRPGRLLAAWLSWLDGDFAASTLLRMLQAGLLRVPDDGGETRLRPARLARVLRDASVGFGRDRYLPRLDGLIAGLQRRPDGAGPAAGGDRDEPDEGPARRRRGALRAARLLRRLVAGLLADAPAPDAGAADVVAAALALLRDHAARRSALDGLARDRLLGELSPMAEALRAGPGPTPPGFDARQWLSELPDRLGVGGSGPQPGRLHVTPLHGGGHSGRPHTVILGLDDTRFPPAGLQDPLLLDSERAQLDDRLATSGRRVAEALDDFAQLLCRLRGRVTLSFSARDIADDRETFASPVVLAAARILTGRPDVDHGGLARLLGTPAAFAPETPDHCLDDGEWWVHLGARDVPPAALDAAADAAHPHLARGRRAGAARSSRRFTEFDGRIEAPGPELDPRRAEGPVLSASRLQEMGRCPLAYFYHHVLGVEPPDDLEIDPERWLTPLQFGTLLHDVLYDFVGELLAGGDWPPDPRRDAERMERIARARLDAARDEIPPPAEEPRRRQERELLRAGQIFVTEQARSDDRVGVPVYLEAAVGLPSQGRGTAIDTAHPVELALRRGGPIRVRARLDRIDRLGGEGRYRIVDYKSGRYTKNHDPPDEFHQGRLLQPALYVAVANVVLKRHFGPRAGVHDFFFFFPSVRAHGRTIEFGGDIATRGLDVVDRLCRLSAGGAFPATDDTDLRDCEYCDYRGACLAVADLKTTCRGSGVKLAEAENDALKPFAELRRDA